MSKIAIVGGGGFAKEIIEVIKMNNDEVYGIFAKTNSLNYPYFGYLDELNEHKSNFDGVILAVGAVDKNGIENRKNIIEFIEKNSIPLISVISPLAIISEEATIEKGVYISHNVIVSSNAYIKSYVSINHSAIVGHDVKLDLNVSIGPQVFLGGGIVVEKNVMIGAGATLRQGIKISENVIIGMGCIVIKNIKSGSIVLPSVSKIYKM